MHYNAVNNILQCFGIINVTLGSPNFASIVVEINEYQVQIDKLS